MLILMGDGLLALQYWGPNVTAGRGVGEGEKTVTKECTTRQVRYERQGIDQSGRHHQTTWAICKTRIYCSYSSRGST